MNLGRLLGWSCSLLVFAGCPTGDGGDGGDDAAAGTTTAAGSSSGNGETLGGSSNGSAEGSGGVTSSASGSAGETSPDTGNDSESGTVPGACPNCGEGEWCDWFGNSCGGPKDEGECKTAPEGCGSIYEPVCGCDGTVYSNACAASGAGVDVDPSGTCEAPEEYFECGFNFCNLEIHYCEVGISDVGGEPTMYTCRDLPVGCASPPTCECLAEVNCAALGCEATKDGGLEVVCPGG